MNSFIAPVALIVPLTMLIFTPGGVQKEQRHCPEPQAAEDPKFHPGQVWEYHTRPREKKSTLTILKIESIPQLGVIVHIRVDKIRLRNCSGGPEPDKFEHMPFSRDAIDRSVVKLVKDHSDVPNFAEGYAEWREDCGGIYTISVAEAIQAGEEVFNNHFGCKLKN
jgi:hypothetical protein